MEENIIKLYNHLGGDQVFGTLEGFKQGLQNEDNRRKAFESTGGDSTFGSYEGFTEGIGISQNSREVNDFDSIEDFSREATNEEFNKALAQRQKDTDEAAKDGEGPGFFERRGIQIKNFVGNTLTDLQGIGAAALDKLGFDEAAEGAFGRFNANRRELQLKRADIPSNLKQRSFERRVVENVDGQDLNIAVDSDGNFQEARDNKGFLVDLDSNFIEQFNQDKRGQDSSIDFLPDNATEVRSLLTTAETTGLDLLGLILGSRGAVSVAKTGAGTLTKKQLRKRAAGAAAVGATIQTFGDNLEESLSELDDRDAAINNAFTKSAATGAITLLGGAFVETGGAAGTSGVVSALFSKGVNQAVKAAAKAGGKNVIRNAVKNTAGEVVEENLDVLAGNAIDMQFGVDTDLFDLEEFLTTTALSAIVSAPVALVANNASGGDNIVNQGILDAATDDAKFSEFSNLLEGSKQSQSVKDKKLKVVEAVRDNINTSDKDLTQQDRLQLIKLISNKEDIRSKISDNLPEQRRNVLTDKISKIDEEISKLTTVDTEAVTEENTQVDQPPDTQSDEVAELEASDITVVDERQIRIDELETQLRTETLSEAEQQSSRNEIENIRSDIKVDEDISVARELQTEQGISTNSIPVDLGGSTTRFDFNGNGYVNRVTQEVATPQEKQDILSTLLQQNETNTQASPLLDDLNANLGRFVNYQGIEGTLVRDGDNFSVLTTEGDAVQVESAQGSPVAELGITPISRPSITDSEVQNILQSDQQNVDLDGIITDITPEGAGTVNIFGDAFPYVGTSYAGNKPRVTLRNSDGNEFTVQGDNALEIERQRLANQLQIDPTTIDETAREISRITKELGLSRKAPIPQVTERVAGPAESVQLSGPSTDSTQNEQTNNLDGNNTNTLPSNTITGRDQTNTGNDIQPTNNQTEPSTTEPGQGAQSSSINPEVPSVQEESGRVQEPKVPEQPNQDAPIATKDTDIADVDFGKRPGNTSNSGLNLASGFTNGLNFSYKQFKDFLSKGENIVLDELNKRGYLRRSPEVYEAMINKTNQVNSILSEAERLRKQLNKATKGWTIQEKQEISNSLNKKGIDNSILPQSQYDTVSDIVEEMRDVIVRLGVEITSIPGVVNDLQTEVILDKLGSYTSRIYEAHRNPNWAAKVESMPDIWNAGITSYRRMLRGRLAAAIRQSNGLQNKISTMPTTTAKERSDKQFVERRLREVNIVKDKLSTILSSPERLHDFVYSELENMSKPDFIPTIQGNKKGAADISILRKRKNVPTEIRELFGEIREPEALFVATVAKMETNIANNQFQQAILDNTQYYSLARDSSKRHTQRVSTADNRLQLFLDQGIKEIYVTPEMGSELNSFMSDNAAGLGFLKAMNAATKLGLTVFSPTTQMRNFIGNIPFMMMNGYFRPNNKFGADVMKELGIETATRLAEFSKGNLAKNKERAQFVDKLVGLGLIGANVDIGEINSLFNDSKLLKRKTKELNEALEKTMAGKFTKRWVFDAWKFAYGASDDMFKMIAFKFETKQFADSLYNKKYENMTPDEQALVDNRAAKVVRDTLPNYNETYKVVKRLKNFALIAPFASFAGEVVRTSMNRIKLIDTERSSKNPKLVKTALHRALGTAGVALFTAAASSMLSDTEDEEHDTLMEYYMPPWVHDAVIQRRDGYYEYINPSTINPIGVLGDVEATVRRDGAFKAVSVFLEPFTSTEPAVQAAGQVYSNEDAFGNAIYTDNPQTIEEVAQNTADILAFLGKKGPIPGIARILLKRRQLHDRIEDKKRKLETVRKKGLIDKDLEKEILLLERQYTNENLSLIGVRRSITDPKTAYRFRFQDKLKRMKTAGNLYFSRTNLGSTDGEREDAYDKSNKIYQEALTHIRDMYSATRTHLGVDLKDQVNDFSIPKTKDRFNKREKDYILGKSSNAPVLYLRDHFERLGLPKPKGVK